MLGAGASEPAGIPLIRNITRGFLQNPIHLTSDLIKSLDHSKISSNIEILTKVTEEHYGKTDIELIMSIILELEDEKSKKLFQNTYSELKEINSEYLSAIKILINQYIRKECEKFEPPNLEYLWPLKGMIHGEQRLKIFTLNYDGALEAYCERNSIEYTDGYDPYWNPNKFESTKVNIFKLHGSLYWLRTESGRFLRIPLKNLQIDQVKYLTDESVSEMMIYPALQKNKQLEVYSWLSQKFIQELNQTRICLIIGYSFRDEDIRNYLINSLYNNRELWLIVVSPHATQYKKQYFSLDDTISSRIVMLDMDMKTAITHRKIISYLDSLGNCRSKEEQIWNIESRNDSTRESDWLDVIITYANIYHYDRIKWIVEKLSEEGHIIGVNRSPLEIIGWKSLEYVFDYDIRGITHKKELWKKFFIEYCTVIEHKYFQSVLLSASNPISDSEVPSWSKVLAKEAVELALPKLKESAEIVKNHSNVNKECERYLTKFIESLNFLIGQRDLH